MATTGILLRKGSTGEQVRQLQKALHLLDDGIFGVLTEEAVKDYQREKRLTPDGIVGQKTWESLFGKVVHPKVAPLNVKKSKRKIDMIIVHCTATPEGDWKTVEQIRAQHIKKGWSDIGYHYLIYLDGSIHIGRDVDKIGAHCEGKNAHSIGVCYVGGLEKQPGAAYNELKAKDTRTAAQKAALLSLLKMLKAVYPGVKIYGHRDFSSKACPSFDAKTEYMNI